MDLDLSGKVAIVTGGARDIGREIALTLAAEGAVVAVHHRGPAAEAQALVAEIEDRGGRARAYRADLAQLSEVTALVDSVIGDFGKLSILVNNAGIAIPRRFAETTPEEWKAQIDTDLYGVIHITHSAVPHLQQDGAGRIISIIGDSTRLGEARLSVAAAARGGVLALMKTLAKELGEHGVTANTVSLGLIETAITRDLIAMSHDKLVRLYPTGRLGRPSDVAPIIALFASPKASWITGQVISVSGGFSTL